GGWRASVRVIRLWLERRRRAAERDADAPPIPGELKALLQQVEQHWARRGHAPPPTRGFREHLDTLPRDPLAAPARELRAAVRDVSAAVVDCYYRASFGRQAPSSASLSDLSSRLASLW